MIWVTVRDLQPCEIVTYCGLWSNYVCVCMDVRVCWGGFYVYSTHENFTKNDSSPD